MSDENNDAPAHTPPPLVPPRVNGSDRGVDRDSGAYDDGGDVAARAATDGDDHRSTDDHRSADDGIDGGSSTDGSSAGAGRDEPLFVEPTDRRDQESDNARVEDGAYAESDDDTRGPVGRDLIEDTPHDPAGPDERRLDPAPQSLAASPIPTVDPPLVNGGGADDDRARDDRAFVEDARDDDARDDRRAPEVDTVSVEHPSTSPAAPPQPLLVPPAEGGVQQTAAYPPVAAPPQRQFVQPPVPPKKKGNRGVGSLIAVLSVIVFAALYLAIGALILALITPAADFGDTVGRFVATSIFWVPAILFVIAFVIVVLLANRASWWAYVLGSLLVGAIVYFGTIGIQLLVENVVAMTPAEARERFVLYAVNPFVIAAALVAREVALWTGSAIAARGRRMKARNVTAREDFERATAEHRAEYERTAY